MALVRRTSPGYAAGNYFPTVGHETAEDAQIFIIYVVQFLFAEIADLSAWESALHARVAATATTALPWSTTTATFPPVTIRSWFVIRTFFHYVLQLTGEDLEKVFLLQVQGRVRELKGKFVISVRSSTVDIDIRDFGLLSLVMYARRSPGLVSALLPLPGGT